MLNDFKKIQPELLSENPIKLISDGMLVTSGSESSFNTMTASWGGIGYLWNKQVCFVFIRPSRYTYEFTEKNDTLSLSFFSDDYKHVLRFCGANSGRDVDKVKSCSLTPIALDTGCIAFNEARIILECKKLSIMDFNSEQFIDPSLIKNYKSEDYHRVYICEITSVLIKEQ